MAGLMTGDADLWWPYIATTFRASYKGQYPGVNYGIANNGASAGIEEQLDSTDAHIHLAFRGLFGIEPAVHEGKINICPAFPSDWKEAAIKLPHIEYTYQREGEECTFHIKSARPLIKIVQANLTGEAVETESETESVVRVKRGAQMLYESPCAAKTLRIKAVPPTKHRQVHSIQVVNQEDCPAELRPPVPLTDSQRRRQVMMKLEQHFNTGWEQLMETKFLFDYDDQPMPLRNFWGLPRVKLADAKSCGPSQHKGLCPRANTVDAITGVRFLIAPMCTTGFPEVKSLLAVSRTEPFPFPCSVTIPIGIKCEQVWPLLQCYSHAMKNYIPNGEIILRYEDGHEELEQLIPPYNMDTYFQHYSLKGVPILMGHLVFDDPWGGGFDNRDVLVAHGDALLIDADPERVLYEIEVRAVCTESVIALAGLTVVEAGED